MIRVFRVCRYLRASPPVTTFHLGESAVSESTVGDALQDLQTTVGLSSETQAAASTAAVHVARLDKRAVIGRVAGIVEDHLVEAGVRQSTKDLNGKH